MKIANKSAKQCDLAGIRRIPLRFAFSSDLKATTDIVLSKERSGITALLYPEQNAFSVRTIKDKIACHAYWFSQTSSAFQSICVNASDGDQPTFADYKFSSASTRETLVPDSHFFRARGYASTDQFSQDHHVDWNDRSDDITWRGRINGAGLFTLSEEVVGKPGVIQRLHMAKKCKEIGVEFKFVQLGEGGQKSTVTAENLLGEFIPTHDWGGKKYAIDIDGYTNAWCNFMQRLKLGCCVLKVDSAFGFRQWYYDRIRPWEHFVPIRADLTDLEAQVDWVRSNQDKAREIAQNGQSFARQMTFETETNFAREAIEKREALS